MSKTTKLVSERVEGDGVTYYDFRCPYSTGCGVSAADPSAEPFSSVGWVNRDHAVARGKQHIREHETGADPNVDTEPMQELEEFRQAHGITSATAGQSARPTEWEF